MAVRRHGVVGVAGDGPQALSALSTSELCRDADAKAPLGVGKRQPTRAAPPCNVRARSDRWQVAAKAGQLSGAVLHRARRRRTKRRRSFKKRLPGNRQGGRSLPRYVSSLLQDCCFPRKLGRKREVGARVGGRVVLRLHDPVVREVLTLEHRTRVLERWRSARSATAFRHERLADPPAPARPSGRGQRRL